jgi:2-oxoglutarate ferredoxin oxidoreductase subunit gamma
MSGTIKVRITGAGGQGVITAGVILAEAAVLDGRNVVQTQSYGPEARLGSSKAEVIISDDPIAYPQIDVPDLLICLSEEAAAKYVPDVGDGTVIVLDSTNVESTVPDRGIVHSAAITQIAEEAGARLTANVVALGVANRLCRVVSAESLREAVLNRVPERHRAMNERALDAAPA